MAYNALPAMLTGGEFDMFMMARSRQLESRHVVSPVPPRAESSRCQEHGQQPVPYGWVCSRLCNSLTLVLTSLSDHILTCSACSLITHAVLSTTHRDGPNSFQTLSFPAMTAQL